jgi:predicted AlkP superfamily phosphohydrolase/phosphomutase/Flp pilus assembly protein TadD
MPEQLASKVLLIGWDAADWRMIRPMLERGELPALAALLRRGTWGNLATIRPILSPMLWTSIATGKRADKHGILGFTEPKPDATGIRPVASTSRTCKALWNIATQNGLRTCAVNWFASHPAEPIRGSVVSDRYTALVQPGVGTPKLPDGAVHPAALAQPLARLLVDPAQLDAAALLPFAPLAGQVDQDQDDRLIKLATLIARTATTHAAACFLLQETAWDVACIYYGGIDEFGHHFMPYHPPHVPGISETDAAIYGPIMSGCYRFHDLMLATLLNIAGPDTTVILVSDHGFHHDAARPGACGYDNPEAWHHPFGIAALAGPGIKANDRLYGGTVLDVTPTILHLLGLPIGADMDGRPWAEVTTGATPPRRVLSWDAVEGEAGLHAQDIREDPAVAAQALKHLADLGYIELPGGDVPQQIESTIDVQQTNLARALTDSRRAQQAIPLWERLIEAHADEPGYRLELARCLVNVGCGEQALGPLQHCGDDPAAQLLRARILLEQDRLDDAITTLEALRETMPDSAMVLARLGQALLRRGRLVEARSALLDAQARQDQDPLIADALSELALREGDFDAAVEHALDAVSLTHHFPRAHYHLGCALAGRGDAERAVLALRTCLGLAPGFTPARAKLAALLPPGSESDDHALIAASARPAPHPSP